MDKGSYTFDELERKYDNFFAPAFEIKVGNQTFSSSTVPIYALEVDLNADGNASGCSFQIGGQYDWENSQWKTELKKALKLGVKLSVQAGYVKKKEIFYGYIDDYTLEYQQNAPPVVSVSGIDGLGYLMSLRDKLAAGQKKPAAVVRELLGKCVSAGFAKKVTVGSLNGFSTPIVKESKVDAWKFLKKLAERYGMSLIALDGELIFDDLLTNTKPILTLTAGVGLHSFSKRVSLAHQIGQYEVRGRDANHKQIRAVVTSVTVGGSGKSAVQLVSGLKQVIQREENEYVRTVEECKRLAQNRMNHIALQMVVGNGTCVGIPELIPGRYLEIDGLDSGTSGLYFVSSVKHSFHDGGYVTSFAVKGAKTE